MKSFRTELENPVVERDILELQNKIAQFRLGKIDEERFRSLRLARGVYGQRQPGVQMIRIKIPFGKLNSTKLLRICDVSDEYSTGRLHITTRQDIQIHYVSLDRTPELWSELEKDDVTLREACGNTVRNITASETSGIDPNEPFDPRPYADTLFNYFLRNPICQEMGRKFKISFSNNPEDTAMAFMHDIGFIAKTKVIDQNEIHGFKVWIGGGLGSQSMHAHLYSEFLPADQILSFTEALLRVFERNGERSRRMKARLKFLIKDWGYEKLVEEIDKEWQIIDKIRPIAYREVEVKSPSILQNLNGYDANQDEFKLWLQNNVLTQKNGFYAIGLKIRLGDIITKHARKIAKWATQYSGDELTLTINQNLLIRHIDEKALPIWYEKLKSIGLADIGFNKFSDITACPGTDTCNLGIASSTGLSLVLENVLNEEYPEFSNNENLSIKLSGCMNACGQHMVSSIGFQGMSIKAKDKRVLPAAQILLGGGRIGDGVGRFGDKLIKVPSKKAPEALRRILNDYKSSNYKSIDFLSYYDGKGEKYFYDLLKDLGNLDNIEAEDFVDWGHSAPYIKAIGIGECAGVVIDLISTLFFESEEKIESAKRSLEEGKIRDGIYHTYSAIVNTAKALLLSEDQKTNTHSSIIENFNKYFIETNRISLGSTFEDFALRLRKEKASAEFAQNYYDDAVRFYLVADQYRKKSLAS